MKIYIKNIFAFILALWGIASACEIDAQNFLPKKPSIERLRQDLVGRKMSQVSDSYFPSGWYLDIIKESEIEGLRYCHRGLMVVNFYISWKCLSKMNMYYIKLQRIFHIILLINSGGKRIISIQKILSSCPVADTTAVFHLVL